MAKGAFLNAYSLVDITDGFSEHECSLLIPALDAVTLVWDRETQEGAEDVFQTIRGRCSGFDIPDLSTPTAEPVQGGDATCIGGYCARIADIGDWTCSQSKQGSGPWVTGYCSRITDVGDWTCSQSKEGENGRVTTEYCSRVTQVNGRYCSQSRDGLTGAIRNDYCA